MRLRKGLERWAERHGCTAGCSLLPLPCCQRLLRCRRHRAAVRHHAAQLGGFRPQSLSTLAATTFWLALARLVLSKAA